tara:strand:+ start:330 stop:548 length:219 start_codon:yes stop_codon:yes gene_type:complete
MYVPCTKEYKGAQRLLLVQAYAQEHVQNQYGWLGGMGSGGIWWKNIFMRTHPDTKSGNLDLNMPIICLKMGS